MSSNILLKPIQLGAISLKNRIIMAPLTRCRADKTKHIPLDIHAKYYSQRAEAGLIIGEASPVSERGLGFPGAGAIFNDQQMEGWRKVVDAVHQKEGKMILQLYHSGRATHSKIQNGLQPWAPSAKAIRGIHFLTQENHEVPHAMTKENIEQLKEEFMQGAKRSKKAGFDGVQLHAANGYVFDEFMRDGSNVRTDEYGGSVENRCRLTLETLDILCQEFGADRVSIRISPITCYNDMIDSNPVKTFTYLLQQLSKRNISFVEIKDDDEPKDFFGYSHPPSKSLIPNVFETFRKAYNGNIVGNGLQTFESATKNINKNLFDAASFGRSFITNPDLVQRFKNNWSLNTNFDPQYSFEGGEKGYIDYPTYQEEK